MKQLIGLLLLLLVFPSCKEENNDRQSKTFSSVSIEPILQDSLLSIRAIDILNDGNLAFAANRNTYGLYNAKSNKLSMSSLKQDSLDLEFRSVAHTASDFFMLSIASPGLLYKTGERGQMELVYEETDSLAFYDAMRFWNNEEGIAIGDATGDCLSIIITRDGGQTWKKIPCDQLPKADQGQAAFAASNTNIAISGEKTWVATGGKISNILYSADRGKSWEVQPTPIIQGLDTQGMYSVDFYDDKLGYAIGGDYTQADENSANKIRTTDGGKSWKLVAQNKNPGYRSCVQFVPNGNGKHLVAVGFKGIDYSSDSGISWRSLSDEGFFTIRFLNDSIAYAAGSKRIAKLKFD